MTFRRMMLCSTLVLLSLGVATGQTRKRADSPDLKEMRDYKLTMDNIQRYVKMYKAAKDDAGVKKCFDNNPPGNAPTLDAGEKLIQACPAAVAVLNSAGFKPREFLVMTGAVISDFAIVAMKKQGTIKEYPPSISPENAAFLEQNYDKLQAMIAPLMSDDK